MDPTVLGFERGALLHMLWIEVSPKIVIVVLRM